MPPDNLLALFINSKGLLSSPLLLINVELMCVHVYVRVCVRACVIVQVVVIEILTLLESFVIHRICFYTH